MSAGVLTETILVKFVNHLIGHLAFALSYLNGSIESSIASFQFIWISLGVLFGSFDYIWNACNDAFKVVYWCI